MTAPHARARADAALEAVVAREGAAQERRHWVRLTRRCNNRCLFCHDALRHDGSAVAPEAARADIAAGRDAGAARLVLSGGEPTIHPQFVELVAAGRAAGYRWIQAISNGRMFAYDRFAERAVAAGLDEVTVSMHGHVPELHDRLVGVRGSFAQAIRGIRNLQALGRVVSIDVVVCKPNVSRLPELLRAFLAMGLHEFDLLHLVPFGRAFEEHRDELSFDPHEARAHVLEALALRHEPGVHLWTNRWPAPLLEGAEELIQDPHKILDEVRGTAEGFEAYLATGVDPECRGERCGRCFLDGFCRALFDARERLAAGAFDVVAVRARDVPLAPGAAADVARQGRAALRVVGASAEEALATLAALPRGDSAEVELELARLDGVPLPLAARTRRAVLRQDEDLAAALALPRAELEVPVERATHRVARRAIDAAPARVVLRLGGRDSLADVLSRDLPPSEVAALGASGVRAEGIPACLAPGARPSAATLDAATLSPSGGLALLPFAEAWVRNGFRARSLRCDACADQPCGGAHVNAVRAFGFGWMRPRAPGARRGA